jgi:hypothetical protein
VRKENQIVVVLGQKGKGKSTLIRRLLAAVPDVCWFDCLGEYHPSLITRAEMSLQLPGFSRTGRIEEALDIIHGKAYERLPFQRRRPFNIVYHATHHRIQELELIWGEMTRRFMETRRPSVLVLDETQLFMRGSWVPPIVERIGSTARHYLVDVFFATRRPAEMPRIATSQANQLYSFAVTEKRDLQYLQSFLPFEHLQNVVKLKWKEYVHVNLDQDRRISYYAPSLFPGG